MPCRSSLVAATLLLLTVAPASAQTGLWTAARPDAVAPSGVFADRTLAAGAFEASVQYARTPLEGVRSGDATLNRLTLFDTFEIVPLGLTTDAYHVRVALGVTEWLTIAARAAYLDRLREQTTADGTYFALESRGVGDIEVQALWQVHSSDGVRAQLHTGVSVPTGSVHASGGVAPFRGEGTLPYDMQLGAGAWGFSPGLTAQVMNDAGVVGGQVLATVHLLERGDWRSGDRVEASAWAAHRLNRYFSVSGRVHVQSFEAIEGLDPDLAPSRDPGEWPISSGGTRVSLPVGLNLYVPEGPWQGHRLSFELHFPVHERFDGPWLETRRSATLGWQLTF